MNGKCSSLATIDDNNGNQLTETLTPYVNGIPQTAQVTTNVFNAFGKLTSSTQPNSTVTAFAYNGEGRRVEKTVGGALTRYLNEYDKAVLEVDSSNQQTARNVFGNSLLARKVGTVVYFYMYNGHADVTALITSAGTISSTYYYDAFGNILEQTGAISNPFRYAGYMFDDDTGNYFLNARYYDPKIARFLSEDTYRGDITDPLSLNIYTYCHNNPIVYWDYTGNWEQGDENLTYEARIEISRLTDMWYNATTDQEREWIHAAADAIRDNPVNYAGYEQYSVTGNAVNSILNQGNEYITPEQWNEISTTKSDEVVQNVLADGIVTPSEVEAISGIKIKNTNVTEGTGDAGEQQKIPLTVIEKTKTTLFIYQNTKYYVQSDKGNVTINGIKYFEANSQETVNLYPVYNIDYDFQSKAYVDGVNNALPEGNLSYIDKVKYVRNESPTGNKLDQKQYLDQETLYLFNNKLYNKNEAGNIIW